jgi:hypothetical protein
MGRRRQFEKNDTYVKLESNLIKVYEDFLLYQVYGVKKNGERVPLYKTSIDRRKCK